MAFDRPKFDIKQPTKSKSWITDQLSTAGGIGGSLGGAALGTAILPGIGTLIGGVLGGALGSGAGEFGENVATGEKDLFKNVGKEALLGGVTGVPVFGTLKGVAGAGKALISGAGKAAANEALAAALKVGTGAVAKGVGKGISSNLSSAGKNIISDVLGIKAGAKLAGKGILKPQYIDDLSNFVSKQVTGKAPNAADVLIKTQNYADDIGKALSKKIANSKIVVNGASISGDIVQNLQKNLLSTDDQLVKGVLDRLKTVKSPNELWELRKIVDDKISWIANPDAATSNMNAIAHTIRDTINKQLDKTGVQSLNKEYSLAQDAIKLIQKPALNPAGIQIGKMNIGGSAAQKAQIAGGRALTGLGNATQGLGTAAQGIGAKIPQGLVGATTRQFGGRALTGSDQGTIGTTPETSMSSPSTQSLFRQQAFGESMQPTQQTSSSPFGVSTDQLAQALMMAYANGDTASAKQLQSMYELSATMDKSTATKSLSSATAGAISDFQSSLSELNNLSQAIATGPGSTDPIFGRIRSLNPYDVDQQTLQSMINKTRQIVGKALEGGVLRKEDEEKYKKILPTTADTKEVALNKIEMIKNQLGAKLQNYSSLVGNSNSIEDVLLNQSQGY